MDQDDNLVLQVLVSFTSISFLAFGGVNVIAPELHRLVVESTGWMTDQQFVQQFAIAQAAPGPNMLVVTLLGWHVAGAMGALAATIGMCGPVCLATYFASGVWDRFRYARWRIAIQAGLIPVTIGLICASAYVLAEAAGKSIGAVVVTVVVAALTYWTRWNPLLFFAAAGVAGVLGIV